MRFKSTDKVVTSGYLYVLEFDTGVVKLGFTTSKARRRQQYLDLARNLRIKVIAEWWSPEHEHAYQHEQSLIAALHQGVPGNQPRSEWFSDRSFADLVRLAEAEPFRVPSPVFRLGTNQFGRRNWNHGEQNLQTV